MTKKIAIMQPYFLPYMGYWQLINAVDEFVLYDQIEYTKKGWVNRNRFLQNGQDTLFSLPLKAASDYLTIVERSLSDSYDRQKLIRQLSEAYKKAPYYKENFPLIENIINFSEQNLFRYIENCVLKICEYLGISTNIVVSSSIDTPDNLKAQDKVIAICKARDAHNYINPIGGLTLYDKAAFSAENIKLSFLRSRVLDYSQFGNEAIPHLSILDVMMFNSREQVKTYLNAFDLE